MRFKTVAKSALIVIIIILALLLLYFFVLKTDIIESDEVNINFKKSTGRISMDYGANEDDNWVDFVKYPEIHNFHKNVGSKYIRVWVSGQEYRDSTIPLQEDGGYDFTVLNTFVKAVLASDAIPFMVFAHDAGTYEEGHGIPPPHSDNEFAQYVGTVVEHFKDTCNDNKFPKPCNVDDWYFEIWNEPYGDEWWEDNPPRYSTLFNEAYEQINLIAPEAKVGGYSLTFHKTSKNDRLKKFLQNSEMDFVSVHHYGNTIEDDISEREKMIQVKELLYDSTIDLRSFIKRYNKNREIEIINSEYNSDHEASYMPHLDEPFTATWYASALIWEIKSQEMDIELFYSGTSNYPDKGFGMWSINTDGSFILWPVYQMKKLFVKYNYKDSKIFETKHDHYSVDVLAVENSQGKFITLVNKRNMANSLSIQVEGVSSKELLDLTSNKKYRLSGDTLEITLEPYEVKFLQVI